MLISMKKLMQFIKMETIKTPMKTQRQGNKAKKK
jgi:hypothetical protein